MQHSKDRLAARVQRSLPVGDGPRERLLALGAEVLSDAELVALLLRTGGGGRDALSLAAWILTRHQGLHGIATVVGSELTKEPGVGPAKSATPVEQPPSDDDVTPESAPAQKFYVRPMTPEESREFYAAREKYYAENGYQTTSVTVPRPSATELKLRKASYKAIRDGLTNALTGGRSLIPVLDGLEATDPYLSGTDKDGPR